MKKIIFVIAIAFVPVIVFAQTSTNFQFNLKVGSEGTDVINLQTFLIEKGYDIPAISSGRLPKGYFGGQTKAAVIRYQRDNGLPGTGFFGPLTRGVANRGGGTVQRGESLKLIMPNGNEYIQQGTKYTITWTGSPGILGTVGTTTGTTTGSLWLAYTPSCLVPVSTSTPACLMAQPAPTLIADSVRLSDKVYVWNVPNTGTLVSYFKVMICKGKSQSCDESDNYFSISTSSTPFITAIKLETPNGGETLKMGTSYQVTWSSSNVSKEVSLRLISNSANYLCKKASGVICPQDVSTVIDVATGLQNNGTYSWLISSSTPLTYVDSVTDSNWGEYWFQICAGNICDDSDQLIKITK